MSGKKPISPRKAPQQERSRALVDSILEAAARVLSADDYDRSSTGKIADKAGVSVGSIYQYFPSKDSLVAAVIEWNVERRARAFREELDRRGELEPEALIDAAVHGALTIVFENRRLFTTLLEQAPRLDRVRTVLAMRNRTGEILKAKLEPHRARLRVKDLDMAIFVALHAVMGLLQTAVYGLPEGRTPADLGAEASALAKRYLLEG
jgi:AcrR family transcriptional regulator